MNETRLGLYTKVLDGGVGGTIIKQEMIKPSKCGVRVFFEAGEDLLPVLNRINDTGGKVVLEKLK